MELLNSKNDGKMIAEKGILKIILPTLEKIDENLSLKEKISKFLDGINFKNDEVIIELFVAANSFKETGFEKYSYDEFIPKIIQNTSMKDAAQIREYISLSFKNWIANYDYLFNRDFRISIFNLIRCFYKYFDNVYKYTVEGEEICIKLKKERKYGIVEEALEKINPKADKKSQIDIFLENIGMESDEITKNAFLIACDIKRVTLENVVYELSKIYPEMKYTRLTNFMREKYKEWVIKNPDFEADNNKMTMTLILSLFAKKFK